MKKISTKADNINIVEKIFSNFLQSEKTAARFVFIVFNNESISSLSDSNENSVSSKNKIARAHVVRKTFFKNNVFDDIQNDETFQMKSSLKKFTFFFKKIRKIISNSNKTRVNSFNAILSIDNNNLTSSSQLQVQMTKSRIDFFQFTFIIEKKIIQLLNIISRRYYLVFLNLKNVNDSIRIVFFNIRFNHDVYKILRTKCFQLYKQWKLMILMIVDKWMTRWIDTNIDEREKKLNNFKTHKNLKREIFSEFESSWLKFVFKFVVFAVDMNELSSKILQFFKC